MRQAIAAMFARHEAAINARLAGRINDGLAFAPRSDVFIVATPSGLRSDAADAATMVDSYRDGGVHRMTILNLRTEVVDLHHAVAFLDWSADRAVDGREDTFDFARTYLVRVEHGEATIFAAITGEEETALTAPTLAQMMV